MILLPFWEMNDIERYNSACYDRSNPEETATHAAFIERQMLAMDEREYKLAAAKDAEQAKFEARFLRERKRKG